MSMSAPATFPSNALEGSTSVPEWKATATPTTPATPAHMPATARAGARGVSSHLRNHREADPHDTPEDGNGPARLCEQSEFEPPVFPVGETLEIAEAQRRVDRDRDDREHQDHPNESDNVEPLPPAAAPASPRVASPRSSRSSRRRLHTVAGRDTHVVRSRQARTATMTPRPE